MARAMFSPSSFPLLSTQRIRKAHLFEEKVQLRSAENKLFISIRARNPSGEYIPEGFLESGFSDSVLRESRCRNRG